MSRYRIGIDVGGTFTDFVLADIRAGDLLFHKEPSAPTDPSAAVEAGLAALIRDRGLAPDAVELVVHGTTIGLNAIIQRRGARMAMVVSKGNRDVLEIARLRLPSSYDFTEPREAPLVPRERMFEIDARLRSDGAVLARPTPADIDGLTEQLAAARVEAVAIMLLNAYRDPTLEIEIAARLRERLPGVLVAEAATLWPEVREYERALVAGLNAFIQPLMTSYFDRLSARVAGLGFRAPIYITANNGGTLSLETARARPIDTVLSGPASGVVASCRVAGAVGETRLVTVDMGGTSADISLVHDGRPEFTTQTFVGDFPLMMPVVAVGAIGAGGGSIVWTDAQGVVKVGPLSAGADPGPVAYGRGGAQPTVTDCYVTLGVIDPDRFLDGRMPLDRPAAEAALDALARGMDAEGDGVGAAAAEWAIDVATARMASELVKLMATAGVDPKDYALVAYGGAGPTHANLLAEAAGLPKVIVPPAPGTFCALGAVLADVRRDYVRTVRILVGAGRDGAPAVGRVLADLEAEAAAFIAREGDVVGGHDFVVAMRMRYPGQAYEIEVAVPADDRARPSDAGLAGCFHAAHRRLYGFDEAATPVQITTVRLGVIGRVPPFELPLADPRVGAARGRRVVRHRGRTLEASIYDRAALGAGAEAVGPAVIEQPDTTTFLLPGWRARADRYGALHLTRSGA
jgi:N-methylhydantoinase A